MGRDAGRTRIPRLFVLGFGAAFILILTVGSLFYKSQAKQLRSEAINTLTSIAELKAGQITGWLRELLADATDDTQNPLTLRALRDRLTGETRDSGRVLLETFELQRKNHGYLLVRLVDAEGRLLLASPQDSEPSHKEALAAFGDAVRERRAVLTPLHMGEGNEHPHLGSVAPIFASGASDSPAIGAVISMIDPGVVFFPLVESWPTPSPSAETLIVTREGENALFLNELRHQKNTALKLRIPLRRAEVPAAMAVQGREGAVEGLDYRGVPVLAVLKKIPETSWFLVSKVDRREAFAGWRTRAALIIALILALAAAAAAAFLMLWQQRAKAHFRAMHRAESIRQAEEKRYFTTLKSIGDGVILTDRTGRVDFLNPAAEALTGWPLSEARALAVEEVFRIVNEDSRLPVKNPVERVLREGLVVGLANHTLLLARDGREIPIADSGAPVRDESGLITGVVLVFSDQTSERRAENEVRRNEARLQALVAVLQHPAESVQDHLDYALNEALRLTGSKIGYIYRYQEDQKQFVLNTWSLEVMKECAVANPPTCYELDKTGVWGEAVRQRRPIVLNDFAADHPLKKGQPEGHARLIRYMTVPIFKGPEIVAVIGVANKESDYTDIDVLQLTLLMESVWRVADRIRAEESLRLSESRFRQLYEKLPLGYQSLDKEGRILDVNQTWLDILGYAREDVIGRWFGDFLRPSSGEAFRERFPKFKERGEVHGAEFEMVRKNGEVAFVSFDGRIGYDAQMQFKQTHCLLADVSARAQMERELRDREDKFRSVFEAANVGKSMTLPTGEVNPNEAFCLMVGYSGEELRNKKWQDITPAEDIEWTEKRLEPLVNREQDSTRFEKRYIRKDGSILWADVSVAAKRDEQGALLYFISTVIDISERKEAEDTIRRSLLEREVMLREIHHRVKNNIQIISSLLRLQARRLDNEQAREALTESQNRIRSMALIHEKLYQTGDLARIEMADYLENTVGHLVSVYRGASGRVASCVEARGVSLDINQAIPIGLIVNELVTNALKHAFPGGRDGDLLVRLAGAEPGKMELTVRDSGIGLSDPGLLQGGSTLGLQIVHDLVRQIEGTMEVGNRGGTEIRIRF